MLNLTRKVGESIKIGEMYNVTVSDCRDGLVTILLEMEEDYGRIAELLVQLAYGASVVIDEDTTISILGHSGRYIKVGIDAPDYMEISRYGGGND